VAEDSRRRAISRPAQEFPGALMTAAAAHRPHPD